MSKWSCGSQVLAWEKESHPSSRLPPLTSSSSLHFHNQSIDDDDRSRRINRQHPSSIFAFGAGVFTHPHPSKSCIAIHRDLYWCCVAWEDQLWSWWCLKQGACQLLLLSTPKIWSSRKQQALCNDCKRGIKRTDKHLAKVQGNLQPADI